jgi:hypothetical protein
MWKFSRALGTAAPGPLYARPKEEIMSYRGFLALLGAAAIIAGLSFVHPHRAEADAVSQIATLDIDG